MRTLINDLLAKGEKRYIATSLVLNDRASVCDGLIESRVQGRNYIGLNALVLSSHEVTELSRLTNLFGEIMTKALAIIVEQEDEKGLASLGWPASLVYALRNEPLNRWLTPIGRFDFALDPDGKWQLMEYNSDTPSGSQEVTQVEERLLDGFKYIKGVTRLNPPIGDWMIDALHKEAEFVPIPRGSSEVFGPFRLPKVGFIARGRYLTDLAQVIYYAKGLESRGLECVIGDPNNLSLVGNRLFLLGKPIDALYRLFPVEHLANEPLFLAYLQANLVGSLKCLNNLRGFLAQSKAVLAWLWRERENRALFTPEERDVLQNHLPETKLITNLPGDFDRSRFIVKEFFGREGAEVYDGELLDEVGWEECKKWQTFVVQRRIELSPVPHAWVTLSGELERLEVYPCVGSFFIGGRSGGCYTRVGGKITTSVAQFIPTLQDVTK